MKDVYLRAAKRVYRRREYWDEFSCLAIDTVMGVLSRSNYSIQAQRYVDTFCANQSDLQRRFDTSDNPRELRVLALLFMHWISQDKP